MARQRFEPARGTRGTAGYEYYELSLAQGPAAIGVTGQNRLVDFIGTAWLLLVDLNMELHLFRQTATVGQWEEVTTLLPPVFGSPLPVGARRVSFCFDQSARVALAYENGGNVFLTRWDPVTDQYVQKSDIPGRDPFVVFDAVWSFDIPSSDVLLFYLSSDSERLMSRVQRDLFNVEYEMWNFSASVVLDRVVRTSLRYQALMADAVGDPFEDVDGRYAMRSLLYPYLEFERIGLEASVDGGEYLLTVLRGDDSGEVGFSASLDAGDYLPSVLRYDRVDDEVSFAAALGDGEYILAVLRYDRVDDEVGFATALDSGEYLFTVIRYDRVDDEVGFSATLEDGSYELA